MPKIYDLTTGTMQDPNAPDEPTQQPKAPAMDDGQDTTFGQMVPVPTPDPISTFNTTLGRSPDQEAEIDRISRQTGLDRKYVELNLPQSKDVSARPDFEALRKNEPTLFSLMADPSFANVAKDDIDALQKVTGAYRGGATPPITQSNRAVSRKTAQGKADEFAAEVRPTIEVFRNNFQKGRNTLLIGAEGRPVMDMAANRSGTDEEIYRLADELSAKYEGQLGGETTGLLAPSATLLGQVEKLFEDSVLKAKPEAVATSLAAMTAAGIAGNIGPQALIPEEIITVPVSGGVAASFVFANEMQKQAYQMEAVNLFLELVKPDPNTGNRIDPQIAAQVAQSYGGIASLLELSGVAILYAPFKRGLLAAAKKRANNIIAARTTGQAVRGAAGTFAGTVAAETGVEITQETAGFIGTEVAKKVDPQDFTAQTSADYVDTVTSVASEMIRGMGVLALPGAAVNFSTDMKSVVKAEQNQAIFEAMGKTPADTKLAERVPEKLRDLVQGIQAEGGAQNIYVDGQRFLDYFQSQAPDAMQQLERVIPGISARVEEAVALEGNVEINTGDFAAHIAPVHGETLWQDIKLSDNDMSINEAKDWRGRQEEEYQNAVQQTEMDQEQITALEASAEQVYEDNVQQLIDSGRYTEQQAQSQATATKLMFRTMAARMGVDPKQLYDSFGLNIQTELPNQAAAAQTAVDAAPTMDQAEVGATGVVFDAEGNPLDVTVQGIQGETGPRVVADDVGNVYTVGEDVFPTDPTAPPPDQTTEDQPLQQSQSTRLPSAVRATEDPLEALLVLDHDITTTDSKTLAKNVALLGKLVNFKPEEGATDQENLDAMITHMADNLLWLHDQMPVEWRDRAKLWYDGGRKTVEEWAKRYGISEAQGAAMIAVLSPQNGWFQNISMAERISDVVIGNRDFKWSEEMTKVASEIATTEAEKLKMAEASGKTLAELLDRPDIAARWVRVYDQAHNSRSYRVITPEGGAAETVKIKSGADATMAWKSYSTIAKAISILTDGRAENIYYQLGAEHKVRNFYNNLFDPNNPEPFATIDTHAVAAALLRPLSAGSNEVLQAFGSMGAASSSITGQRGTYPIYLEAYKRAAEQRGLLPRQMQSITWEAVRGLFEAAKKKGMKTNAEAIWQKYQEGALTQEQAQQQIIDLADGITAPAWTFTEFDDTVRSSYVGPAQENINYGSKEAGETPPTNVMFEVAPDPNNKELTQRWNALPDDLKLAISQRVAGTIVADVLTEFSVAGRFSMQVGGYEGQTNPSLTLTVDNPELSVQIARLLGYALSQDSMMVVAGSNVIGTDQTGAITISLPEGYGQKEIEALYNVLYEIEVDGDRIVGGHTTVDGQMAILNFSAVPDDEFARLIDEKLKANGNDFPVAIHQVYAAFPEKEDYQYGSDRQAGAKATAKSPVLKRPDQLRDKATQELERELGETGGEARQEVDTEAAKLSARITVFEQRAAEGPTQEALEVRRMAEEDKMDWINDVEAMAAAVGGAQVDGIVNFAVKQNISRMEQKIRSKQGRKGPKITDGLRSTILSGEILRDPQNFLNQVIEAARAQGYEVWINDRGVEDIDNLYDLGEEGYKHIAIKLVKNQAEPLVRELLLVTPNMFWAKEQFIGHTFYDITRFIDAELPNITDELAIAKELGNNFTDIEDVQRALTYFMDALYAEATKADRAALTNSISSGLAAPNAANVQMTSMGTFSPEAFETEVRSALKNFPAPTFARLYNALRDSSAVKSALLRLIESPPHLARVANEQAGINHNDTPPRFEGESDKEFAKRVIDHGPAPAVLPDDQWKYFTMDTPDAVFLPVEMLRNTKPLSTEDGGNAAKRMWAAFEEKLNRREPITVQKRPDGLYDILNGNGTYAAALKYGWGNLPVQIVNPEMLQQSAYHGTGHVFDKFMLDKVGSGEGAQVYGWGLYFASLKQTAQWYREKMSVRGKTGRLFKVELAPKDDEWLLWDVGYKKQSPKVQKILTEMAQQYRDDTFMQEVSDHSAMVLELQQEIESTEGFNPAWYTPSFRRDLPEDIAYKLEVLSEAEQVMLQYVNDPRYRLSQVFAASKMEDNTYGAGITGEGIVRAMGELIGPKETSLLLLENGIRGNKYLDGMSRQDGIGTYNYVLFDDRDVTVVDFEQRGNDDPRGGIKFNPGQTDLYLLENTDLSTYLHESGHLYMQMLKELAAKPNAPQSIRDDWAAVQKWVQAVEDPKTMRTQYNKYLRNTDKFGGRDLDALSNVERADALNRLKSEYFARGFEAYLFEGKAPSPELRSVFAQFSQWLVQIYQTIRNLDVKLTDEVREVFDRMLASDAEIEQASNEMSYSSLFTDAAAAGMTEQEWQAYQNAIIAARDQANQEMREEMLKQLRRERQQAFKERKAQIREEVANEVNQMPVFVAKSVMMHGKLPGGEAVEEKIKLSTQDLRDRGYDQNTIKRLPFMVAKEGGVDIDTAAELFGFATGDEMISAIIGSQSREQLINERTEARARAEEGDIMGDAEAMQEEASDAVHNNKRGSLLLTELKRLARLAGGREVAPEAIIKQAAQRIIAAKKIGALRPDHYQRNEGKAAREVVRALAKQDYEEAFRAQQRRILNHQLYRAARDARQAVDKGVAKMKRLEKPAAQKRLARARGEFREQINAILERFDFKAISMNKIEERKTLLEFVLDQEKLGEDIVVDPALLNEARRTNYRELTFTQFNGIVETVNHLEHLAKVKNRLLDIGEKNDIDEAAAELESAAQENGKRQRKKPIDKATMSWYEKRKSGLQEFDATLIKAEQLFDWLDGGDVKGPWSTYFWDAFSNAQNQENIMLEEYLEPLAKSFLRLTKERGAKLKDKVFIESLGQEFTRGALLSFGLNLGNESNASKLIGGLDLSPEQTAEITDKLTKDDWEFCQEIWDLIEGLWPEIEALEKKVRGVVPDRVQVRPINTKFGTYRGGYYPVVYDHASVAGSKQLTDEQKALYEQATTKATTPKGHLQARIESFSAPINLDLNVIPSHLSKVIHDLTHRTAVSNANKLLARKDVRAAITENLGEAYVGMLDRWVKGVANDRAFVNNDGLGWWNNKFRRFRLNTSVVAMGFKATTMMSQFAGFTNALDMVEARYVAQGVKRMTYSPLATAEWIFSQSREMKDRIRQRDREVRDALRSLTGRTDVTAKVREMAFVGIGYADLYVAASTWVGAYEKYMAENDGDFQGAARFADRVVRLTQSSGASKDLAQVQREGNEMVKSLTMFYSYFSGLYSRLRDMGYKFGGEDNFRRTVARSFYLVFIPSIMGELLAKRGPDEDDDANWMTWALKTMLFYPMATIPGIRDIARTIESGYDYKFSPVVAVGEKVARLGTSTFNAISGEGDWDRIPGQAFEAAGYLLGLPTAQGKITGGFIWDVLSGEQDIDSPLDLLGLAYRRKED